MRESYESCVEKDAQKAEITVGVDEENNNGPQPECSNRGTNTPRFRIANRACITSQVNRFMLLISRSLAAHPIRHK